MNWIWLEKEEKNSFAEFMLPFRYDGGDIVLRIGSDYKYAAYIGENMVSCGQYSDIPEYKCINKADISSFVQKGENTLHVIAWHMGEEFSVCRLMPASVAFEIVADGVVIAQSDKNTLSRAARGYRGGDQITTQLGFGIDYDFTDNGTEWNASREVDTGFVECERPIRELTVGELRVPRIAAQGIFKYRGGEASAEKMQKSWLSTVSFAEMTGKTRGNEDTLLNPLTFKAEGGDGIFVITDLGCECAGFLGFSVKVESPCRMLLGWGEHLADLRVRTRIGIRNFASEFMLNSGNNSLDCHLLRLGCRYISIYVETDMLTLSRLGIREVGYPFAFPEKKFGDRLLDAIFETGRRTLYLSAHEHYEDCPWREQALYGMDSRNQMLFGYSAFGEYEYPRQNLMLIARCLKSDGLIPLTAPTTRKMTIPSFTAHWLIAIADNADADYNAEFIGEIMPYAERAMSALFAQEGEHGLKLFNGVDAWNFHEWSDGLDGEGISRRDGIKARGDALLTALTSIAAARLAKLEERLGNTDLADKWGRAAHRLSEALEDYYDGERKLYASYIEDGEKIGYHEYTQALALCTGAVPDDRVKHICDVLRAPAEHGITTISLSALQFKYEALIRYSDDLDFCVEDVVRIFGKMLLSGATSYWETEFGEADFLDAGSLCHGWSAVVCWVLDQYQTKRDNEQ